MPADQVPYADFAGETRERTGPRHAAPKKPLFTRLHVPAGKAIAIASMPTAILMGMGFTPTLANAKDGVTNPFKAGPCVTQPDEASESESPSPTASPDASETPDATPEPTPSATATGSDAGSSPDSGSDDKPEPTPSASASKAPVENAEPTPSPTESESENPLDPLGIGDAIEDILTPDDKETASPTPAPTTSAPTAEDPADEPADKPADKPEDTTDKPGDSADKAGDDAADKAGEEADEATATPSPSASTTEEAKDADGKEAFPCVVEKKVAGEDESTPVTLPVEPWYLESSGLLLEGLDYEGVVNVTTADGTVKQALKFTAKKVDIADLHQSVKDTQSGKTYHVEAAKGSTSTIRNGTVTMYTESLQGNLFGLIPVTFDPEHPPPINTPIAYFTKVKIKQAGQFGGDLTVPGLHQYTTD
ncbi:hypothetical protein [Streptomyces fructofermentans]|uniref:hypothetical protein n=1 Tax=Streptomyces fructofermentans TaxID=152141 RepID=UPI003793DB14